MTVRAKFFVTRLETTMGSRAVTGAGAIMNGRQQFEHCEMKTVVMAPVYANGDLEHENTKFWQASPQGEVRLGTVNAEAAAQFAIGKAYYIDFTPAE